MTQRPAEIRNADLGGGRPQTVSLGGPDDPIDADGCAVTAGLTDHHLHLHAMAAGALSIPCGPPEVTSWPGLRAALVAAPVDRDGWRRGIGYVETVAGDLTRDVIDQIDSTRPIRVQHRSGALWMLNSAAVEAVRLDDARHRGVERDQDGRVTGRLWRADEWLRSVLPAAEPPDLSTVGRLLTSYGIVEITDATPVLDDTALRSLVDAVTTGALPHRLHLLGAPLDTTPPSHPRVSVGPWKIVIGDSALPTLDDLIAQVRAAHDRDRGVAVHCVSHVALALLIAAWTVTGTHPDDRIEHAGMVAADACPTLAELGITVVTQPGFIAARGDDFLRDSAVEDHDDLYRCGSLIRAGVDVVLSSDAPYGPLDPWKVMSAATVRRTATGTRVGRASETIDAAAALDLYQRSACDPSRGVHPGPPGDAADLIVLDRPRVDAMADPGDVTVTHTLIEGRLV